MTRDGGPAGTPEHGLYLLLGVLYAGFVEVWIIGCAVMLLWGARP